METASDVSAAMFTVDEQDDAEVSSMRKRRRQEMREEVRKIAQAAADDEEVQRVKPAGKNTASATKEKRGDTWKVVKKANSDGPGESRPEPEGKVKKVQSDREKRIPSEISDVFKVTDGFKALFTDVVSFEVKLDRSGSFAKFGIDCRELDKAILEVISISPGRVAEWNTSHPDEAICVGDRIVAVNGIQGRSAYLLQKMLTEPQVELFVVRPNQGILN